VKRLIKKVIVQDVPFVDYFEYLLKYKTSLTKLIEYSLIYFVSIHGFGYGWIILVFLLLALQDFQRSDETAEEITQKNTAETGSTIRNDEIPDASLQLNSYNQRRSANEIPAYVLYPDMERVDWINQILNQLWPNINSYSTYFVIKYIEPHIQRILKNLYLKKGFKLKVQKINLGSSPIQVLGVKCYRDNQSNQEQIILDCDLSYKGNGKADFTLQGMKGELKSIALRGNLRLVFRNLVNAFPFVSTVELYFVKMPDINYKFNGSGSIGNLPGIFDFIDHIVHSEIESYFVWPNSLKLSLPICDNNDG